MLLLQIAKTVFHSQPRIDYHFNRVFEPMILLDWIGFDFRVESSPTGNFKLEIHELQDDPIIIGHVGKNLVLQKRIRCFF